MRDTPDAASATLDELTLAPSVPHGANGDFRYRHNPRALYVGCFDGSSNPIPNCSLDIELQVDATSGGHAHGASFPPRPPGELGASLEDLVNSDGRSTNHNKLTVITDSSGGTAIYYLPSVVGGETIVKFTPGDGSMPEVDLKLHTRTDFADCDDPISTKSQALCQLIPNGLTLTLTGSTSAQSAFHPSNHFGTSGFLGKLDSIADSWFINAAISK